MATYDWQERHIIGLDGHEIALKQKIYMSTTVATNLSRELI